VTTILEMEVFLYIHGDGKDQEVYIVRPNELTLVPSYLKISELLPKADRRSRLVIVESKNRIKRLRKEIIAEGMIPVRMQPLS